MDTGEIWTYDVSLTSSTSSSDPINATELISMIIVFLFGSFLMKVCVAVCDLRREQNPSRSFPILPDIIHAAGWYVLSCCPKRCPRKYRLSASILLLLLMLLLMTGVRNNRMASFCREMKFSLPVCLCITLLSPPFSAGGMDHELYTRSLLHKKA